MSKSQRTIGDLLQAARSQVDSPSNCDPEVLAAARNERDKAEQEWKEFLGKCLITRLSPTEFDTKYGSYLEQCRSELRQQGQWEESKRAWEKFCERVQVADEIWEFDTKQFTRGWDKGIAVTTDGKVVDYFTMEICSFTFSRIDDA